MTTATIGILGGTFDPIHYGHLRLAQEVAQALPLHEVRFVPAGVPPLRAPPRTAIEHRVAMVRLAIADNPLFTLDERETRRSGPSYTFDTLCALRAELGTGVSLVLIMGADAFLGLHRWYRWRDIFELAHIAVAHRPGVLLGEIKEATLAQELASRTVQEVQALAGSAAGSIAVVPIPLLDISATAIRAAIAAGRSVRYLLPDEVAAYINRQGLFLKEN